jgi:hypothetical protein
MKYTKWDKWLLENISIPVQYTFFTLVSNCVQISISFNLLSIQKQVSLDVIRGNLEPGQYSTNTDTQ